MADDFYYKVSRNCIHKTIPIDFLVRVLGYDRMSKAFFDQIETLNPLSFRRYYNYCLMDWEITPETKLVRDEETGIWEDDWKEFQPSQADIIEDREAREEAFQLQKDFSKEQRRQFFK